MMYVGIDDTDMPETRGTNQLAREISRRAAGSWTCLRILRHQLLYDPRIPYTCKNGSASMLFEPVRPNSIAELIALCRETMREWFIEGSDPGLCVTEQVSREVQDFGARCQQQIMSQAEAREVAQRQGVYLEGLGGTHGGIIGSLAAVGLAAAGNDGRIIQWGNWPDDLSFEQSIAALRQREITVCDQETGAEVQQGIVHVGKHLRPNFRGDQAVLFVRRDSPEGPWIAVKMP